MEDPLSPSEPFVKEEVVKEEEDEDPDDFYNDDDGDSTSYKPRPQLSPSIVVVRHLQWLMNALEAGNIDVDPEYQREVVWTADRMTGLVNSLMENYYIPPIILNKKPLPNQGDGPIRHILVCVDGKQRLSSVQAFVKGIIPCNDHLGQKWYFWEHPQGRSRNVLSEMDRKQFLAKEFVSFEFADLTTEQEEDLFARVQMGVQLNLAEKMRAATGPWQELGKLFVDDFPTIVSLLKDRSRAKDFQMVLSCFSQILEVQHPTNANGIPILKTNHKALPKFLENRGALDDATKSHLRSVFKTFKELIELDPDTFTNVGKAFTHVQTFAPVEMVAIAVLISLYSETRNNRLLIGDIRQFRTVLREHHKDLRMHADVWKTTWNYVDNLEQIRGAVDGSTIDRTAQEPSPAPTEPVAEPEQPGPSTAPIMKRGRPTMRTKHPKVAPGTAVSKKKPSMHSDDARPPKRPRIEEESPLIVQERAVALLPPTSPGGPTVGPAAGSMGVSLQNANHPPPPSKKSNPIPRRKTAMQLQEPTAGLLPSSPGGSAASPVDIPSSASPPNANNAPRPKSASRRKSGSKPAPPSIDVELGAQKIAEVRAHATQVSKPNNYRAPTAPMGTNAPQAPAATTTAPSNLSYFAENSYNPNAPAQRSPIMGAAPPNYVPYPYNHHNNHIDQRLWQAAPENPYTNLYFYGFPPHAPRPQSTPAAAQPRYQAPPPAAPVAPPAPTPQPRKSPAQQPVPVAAPSPQSDIIDLTEETEQERQDLLSSFRGRATNNRSNAPDAGTGQLPLRPQTQAQLPLQPQIQTQMQAQAPAHLPNPIQPKTRDKAFPGDPRVGYVVPASKQPSHPHSHAQAVQLERERAAYAEPREIRRRQRSSKYDSRIIPID